MYLTGFSTPSELYSPNAIEGMLVDSFPHDYVTPNLRNGSGLQNAVYSITVGTAVSNTDYTVSVNGISATFTSGTSATVSDIRTGIITALSNDPMIRGLAVAAIGTDITVSARGIGTANAIEVTVSGGGTGFAATKLQDALDPKRIPFGRVIATGLTDPAGVGKLPQASTDVPRCVNVRTDAHANIEGLGLTDEDGVNPGEMINSLNRGRVWMRVLTDFSPSSTVFYGVGGTTAGMVRAGAATGFLQLTGARFDSSGTAGALGIVALNF
jgi:hypothetical protein